MKKRVNSLTVEEKTDRRRPLPDRSQEIRDAVGQLRASLLEIPELEFATIVVSNDAALCNRRDFTPEMLRKLVPSPRVAVNFHFDAGSDVEMHLQILAAVGSLGAVMTDRLARAWGLPHETILSGVEEILADADRPQDEAQSVAEELVPTDKEPQDGHDT